MSRFEIKHGITFFYLIAAVVAYIAGSAWGIVIFLVVGIVLESVFWLRLLRRKEHL